MEFFFFIIFTSLENKSLAEAKHTEARIPDTLKFNVLSEPGHLALAEEVAPNFGLTRGGLFLLAEFYRRVGRDRVERAGGRWLILIDYNAVNSNDFGAEFDLDRLRLIRFDVSLFWPAL